MNTWLGRAHAAVLTAIGLVLLAGGTMLAGEGGSLYYLAAGAAMSLSGLLAWRHDPRSARVYGVFLLATLAWSIYEVGFEAWGLIARLGALSVIGAPFLLQRGPKRALRTAAPRRLRLRHVAFALAAAILCGAGTRALGPAQAIDPLWARGKAPAVAARSGVSAGADRKDWPHYGNDAGGSRFSPLAQITPANVRKLEVAWEADVGPPSPGPRASLQVTPINIGDALFVCNGHNMVLSLDAETGKERWRYDLNTGVAPSGKPCRGVSYFRVTNATGMCAERIIATNQTPELFALDASTGRPCPGFGENGRVPLLEGMGDVPTGYHYVSSAPQIVRGNAVFGGAIMDGQYWGEPSGVIRAYDLVTGRLAWAFDAGRPDRRGAPPPGETYTRSTPNSWAPISADEELGLVYLPTGNATPDFYGAQRRPFDDDLASSVIALDAETGALRWRFQTVHHDIWDYDVPSQPTLVNLPTPGGVRRALIQPTKRGEIFVLDRLTGAPLKTVSELPVPQGGIAPGERLSPTQPFSTAMPSFRGAMLRESNMWGLTPVDQMMCRIMFKRARYEGTLTPPTPGRSIILDPGYGGGINWGSISVDIDQNVMIVNWMRMPTRIELMPRAEATARGFRRFDGSTGQGSPQAPMENTPYAATVKPFVSPLGIPCVNPPWGLITAVDLKTGQAIWSRPLGTGRDSGPFGIRSRLSVTMGVPGSGGSVTTRGGLVFTGFAVDSMFRAFDTATGEQLWQADLPGSGMATPMSYASPRSGRQFVVVAAGGRPGMSARLSTKIVAYALPR
ncbi:quinate dehydrogenase [Pseudoduganella albidiflava]|uniref:Membrane-bound PQQ-dependent dehydrogenase, glucose/quinate/shikimate family n=2 Tax=Pseudoduganella albidiflava TaxID=321983 RepID=A0A411X873_9BURK|nr:membrane-bound PQQ-dependent dehydrogenase, glucose/quinate/shikimate family [Pseudoduganella albidiflava]GGY67434.1 quinate dehydrogenase [Pseudoduganella albidiflava]